MRLKQIARILSVSKCLWLILGLFFPIYHIGAQCIVPSAPTKEYIRLGGHLVAIETAPRSMGVAPFSASLGGGQTQQFSATIINTPTQGVTWSINPSVGSIDQNGLYTAPSTVSDTQTVVITATSTDSPSLSACGTVTLNPPVTVSISPASVVLKSGQTVQFSATIAGTP